MTDIIEGPIVSDPIPLPVNLTVQDWNYILSVLVRQPYSEVHALLARLQLPAPAPLPLPTSPFEPPPKRPE